MIMGHLERLSAALWKLQQSGTFCDTVVIVSGNGEILAHAAVLAAASVQMGSMLKQIHSNSADNSSTCQYQLDVADYDTSVVAALLEFIYTGKITASSSTNGSTSSDVIGLSAVLGITLDDSCTDIELPKNVAYCPLTEPDNSAHCNCKTIEYHSNANEIREIPASDKMPKTVSGCASDGILCLHPENNQQRLIDRTHSAECSSSCDVLCKFSSDGDQREVKVEAQSPHHLCTEVAESDSGARTSSSNVKRLRRKQVNCGTSSSSSSVCSKISSPRGCLLQHRNDKVEKLNCSHCQHLCTEGTEATVELKPLEAAVKTDVSDAFATVDADHLRLNSCDASGLKQQSPQSFGTSRASNSADGRSSRRRHQCAVCSRRCSTAAALRQHEQVHVEGTSRSAATPCRTCGKKFRHLPYLRCHERLHEGGERPFVCDVCGKGFMNSSNLTTHRRTHTGERPFACSVCHKRFFQQCAVREHEKIHVGVKMFVCDVCGKQFMTQAQLYNHSRTHGGEKSFECQVCKKRFYTNGDLVKHARIHADQRPFVCDVCGKGFKYSSNLHGHSRIHTGSRPFRCQTCGKAFTYSSHLTRHAKMHTRNSVVLEEPTVAVKDEVASLPALTPSTSNIVGVASTTPSAILIVRPELLIGGPQVATSILSGFPVGPFTRLCN